MAVRDLRRALPGRGGARLINPENTFAAIADILGFLFLIVGTFWIVEAFAAKEVNPLWCWA